MKHVAGKVAFITGGASGIGFGMAQAFLHAGMKVVIADVRQDHLEQALRQLAAVDSGRYHLMHLDVTDRAAMARAAEDSERVFGKVHVLCNNAGVTPRNSMEVAGYEEWDWVMNVNVNGVINGIVSFLPKLRAHGEGGHIVNTSSMAGLLPMPPPGGIYSASKFAVRGLSDSLRLALASQKIGVSVLCPGLTRTNFADSIKTLSPRSVAEPPDTGSEVSPFGSDFNPLDAGVDPRTIGERVLLGIQRNDAYILTHGEFKQELREVFDEILAAFPDEEGIDPLRLQIEQGRADAVRRAKALASSQD